MHQTLEFFYGVASIEPVDDVAANREVREPDELHRKRTEFRGAVDFGCERGVFRYRRNALGGRADVPTSCRDTPRMVVPRLVTIRDDDEFAAPDTPQIQGPFSA